MTVTKIEVEIPRFPDQPHRLVLTTDEAHPGMVAVNLDQNRASPVPGVQVLNVTKELADQLVRAGFPNQFAVD